jgi:hypothetical protein
MSRPIDPNELAQHLQLVIKDSSISPEEKSGWFACPCKAVHLNNSILCIMNLDANQQALSSDACWLLNTTQTRMLKIVLMR